MREQLRLRLLWAVVAMASLAKAADVRRVLNPSARLVKTIGMRAPSTRPVRHNVTVQPCSREGCIQMRWIEVSRDLREEINVVTAYDPHERSRVADSQFVESPVPEHLGVHRITSVGSRSLALDRRALSSDRAR
jgi:hypothetical protein